MRPAVLASAVLALVALAPPPLRAAITLRDLVEFAEPSETALAPDGKRIVFTVTQADPETNDLRSRVWYFDPGGRHVRQHVEKLVGLRDEVDKPRARPLTSDDRHAEQPAFLPDGRHVSFLSTGPWDDEPLQVWVLPLAGGEPERWSDSPTDILQYGWAPDGTLVYLAEESEPDEIAEHREWRRELGYDEIVVDADRPGLAIWTISPEDVAARRVYGGDPGIVEMALSFDGKHVAFTSDGTGDPSHWNRVDVWTLSLESGEASRLTRRLGEEWSPRWSHDGETVFFLAALDSAKSFSQVNVWGVPAGGGPWQLISGDLDRDVVELETCSDSDRVYVIVEDGVNEQLWRFRPGNWRAEKLTDDAGEIRSLAMKGNGERATFILEGPGSFPEIATWTYPDDYTEVRTALNETISARADAEHRVVRWPAPDGTEIEGVLVLPAPAERPEGPLPTVVLLHGGPADNTTNTARTFGSFAGRGYAVLGVNYRGSTGYGAEFNVANHRDLGGADFLDVMAGVDMLVAEGIADPDRLGIVGASYGGFLVNRAVTTTDRFRAAVSAFGIASFISDFGNSEMSEFEHDYFGAYPWEDPEAYRRISPLDDVGAVQTPLLLLHGELDTNTALANSRELYTSLKARGAEVQMVIYPREDHGFSEPAHDLDSRERTLEWIDRRLRGDDRTDGRIGTPLRAEGWTLLVRSAEISAGGLLVVDCVLASDDDVDERPLTITGEQPAFTLSGSDGRARPPVGTVSGSPGLLVRGRQSVTLSGRPDDGTASWSLRLAFDPDNHHSPAEFRAMGLPPVRISWKEEP
ncbi:MAG TPA: S9 family peptidase [bacterium]|nr:S9 family peptidase [bacterium]